MGANLPDAMSRNSDVNFSWNLLKGEHVVRDPHTESMEKGWES